MPHKSTRSLKPVPDPAAGLKKALEADPGPLVVTVAMNRLNKHVSLTDNGNGIEDLEIIIGLLNMARDLAQRNLVAMAEERGKAQAAEAAPA